MSYVANGQKDWIDMMFGDETYKTMLETFGKLVEDKVLRAEQKTELQRSKNPFKDLRERFAGEEQSVKKAVDDLVKDAKDGQNISGDIHSLILSTLDAVGEKIKQDGKIPQEVYDQIVEFAVPCMAFSEELGGVGFPYLMFIAFLETLGKASPSVGVRFAISNTAAEGLRINHQSGDLSDYGEKILRDLISGEKIAAFCLTEASASGSNIMQEMATRAVPVDGGKSYRITGNKFWITNAEVADVYVVFARTSDDPKHGVSLFIVEKGAKGFSIGQVFEKRVVENSSLAELIFNEVEVPADHLVGKLGFGVQYGIRMLNSGRVTIAALATGLAQRAFDEYMEIAVEGKKSAGKQLAEYDRTRARIAEMSVEINASRDMTYRAAWLKQRYDADAENPENLREYVIQGNGAKLKSSLVVQRVCDYLVKIGGASSIVKETSGMKHYLDSFLFYFGEAVPEVLENVIAQMEVKKYKARKGL